MEIKDIRQLASLMKEAGLTTLEYSEGGAVIRMERSTALPAYPFVPAPQAVPASPSEVAASHSETADGIHTVVSPMVGVFYAAPAADKAPYVSVGDHVNAGDVLCIVEAMKMMNEIAADRSGVVSEVCVGNKQIVEYGHPLFRITPD